jgi:hypothetical protein
MALREGAALGSHAYPFWRFLLMTGACVDHYRSWSDQPAADNASPVGPQARRQDSCKGMEVGIAPGNKA